MDDISNTIAARKRGRPGRLSRESVLEATIKVLAEVSLDGFSLALVAKQLGAGVMSLYTYFPSRDSLLLAAADEIYSRFEPPAPRENWQDEVRDWMWATVRLFDHYPIAVKLSTWDGHVSPAWLRSWFPIVRLIRRQNLEGARLAFTLSWFSNASMSFIVAQMSSSRNREIDAIIHISELDIDEQRLATSLWLDFDTLERDALLSFGFDNIIDGLERLCQKVCTCR